MRSLRRKSLVGDELQQTTIVAAKQQKMRRSRTTSEFLHKYFLAGQKTHDDLVATNGDVSPFEKFVSRNRKLISILTPFFIVHAVYWLLVFKYDTLHLFAERYEMSLVMIFGAIVGGATAEGGGAIAFPVMTLLLKVRPMVARDFSVMIQSVGLNSAAVSINLMGVLVEKHTLIFTSIGGTAGTIFALELLDQALSPAVKKISFVSIFFSFAIALFILNQEKKRVTFDQIPHFDVWKALVLLVTGFVGGIFSGIAGSGIEVVAFSVITLLFRINEKVATPTTVSIAGVNSLVVFFWRHFMQQNIEMLAWEYFAVCVPIVTVFAPLGSMVSSHFHRQTLAVFIYVLETIALITAFAVLRPGWQMWLLAASIIVVAFGLFKLLATAGERVLREYGSVVEDEEAPSNSAANLKECNSATFVLDV